MKWQRSPKTRPQHHQQLKQNPKQGEDEGGHQNLPRRILKVKKTNPTARKQRQFLRPLARCHAQSVTWSSPRQLRSGHIRKRSTHSARHIHAKNVRRALTVLSSWRHTWPVHTRLVVTPARRVARASVGKATLKPTSRAMGRRMRSLLEAARDKLSAREGSGALTERG